MKRQMLLSLAGCILLLVPIVLATAGCMPGPFAKVKVSNLQVITEPSNALIYLRQRVEPTIKDTTSPLPTRGEYWAVGTTPYRGDIDTGFWDMRIEVPGYEPIDILVRAESGKVHIYEFELLPSRMATR